MATPAPEPQRFGKYQIVERIAAGGMAEIFKARLDGIGGFHRTFAIKRILPHLTTNPEFVDMLVDEAKVAGLLSHANIVQILDLGSIDQQYYIAMEYVNGRDLGQLLGRCAEKGITLPVPHAVYLLLEMLKGLEYAHNRQVMRGGRPVPLNIVHRDISPANVLVSFQGEVKLTDFGIAKASVKALETMSGVVKGRFDYMSPEQASGGELDQRSDLYSAGVVLYEVLTGRHPFRQPGELATIEAIRRGTYEPPSYVNPDVPYALDLVVEQALKANPAERFATATAFKDALDRFFHDAGFIFSASTLAAFLKGLFPESESRGAPGPVLATPRTPTRLPRSQPDDVSLDDDSASSTTNRRRSAAPALPTADSTLQDIAGLLRALPDAGQSGAFGPVAGLADESTLIRAAPGVDPREWSEAATALRPDPAARAEPANRNLAAPRPNGLPASTPLPSPPMPARPARADTANGGARARPSETSTARFPSVSSVPGPTPGPRAAESPRGPLRDAPGASPEARQRVVHRTPAHVHLLYVALAVMTAMVGLGLGLFAGSATASSAPEEPPVLKLDPIVEIHFPEGATVTLDGRDVPGPSPATTTLAAGRSALVRVSAPGHAPAQSQVVLDYNQMRVLDFVPVELKKKDP
ncbi:MAG: protein kinase [Pseudomonadota bacterium]|nr:protein kinase [Pseudomonadota bacterium]